MGKYKIFTIPAEAGIQENITCTTQYTQPLILQHLPSEGGRDEWFIAFLPPRLHPLTLTNTVKHISVTSEFQSIGR